MKIALQSKNIVGSSFHKEGTLLIEDGKIKGIVDSISPDQVDIFEDFGDALIMPGLVDTHVHVNEPGRTDWEGFRTATQAAAAGGITTIVDMPLNCLPVTTTKKNFDIKLEAIKGKLYVNVGFWGGVTPLDLKDLPELLDSGVMGVKSFLIDSGIPEFPPMTKEDLNEAMPFISKADLPYLIHAELDDGKTKDLEINKNYESFLKTRPRNWENDAITLMGSLSEKHSCKVHIVHLSSSDILPYLKEQKEKNPLLTVETCPHYLVLASEKIPPGKTLFKCCPPIREENNREALWNGVKEGIVDFIVSDHSPCTPNLKLMEQEDLERAWGGISSLQFSLPLVWTEGRNQGLSPSDLVSLLCSKPAKLIGLDKQKGDLLPGMDADIVVWRPDKQFTITKEKILFKNKITPYEGRTVNGLIEKTYLGGKLIYENGLMPFGPFGKSILKETQKEMKIKKFNGLENSDAIKEAFKCCSSQKWAENLIKRRPFITFQEMVKKSEDVWFKLSSEDWLEAFKGHAKIGDLESLQKKYNQTKSWSHGEQNGVKETPLSVLKELKELNDVYEEKYGFIFIVCATGKSAEEMLEILKKRLHNDRSDELKIAISEQNKITNIRLEKLLWEL